MDREPWLRTRRRSGCRMQPGRRVREGGLCDLPAANSFAPRADGTVPDRGATPSNDTFTWCRRAGALDAACSRAAESAKADFATFQRRIHFIRSAGGRHGAGSGAQHHRMTHSPDADAQALRTPHTARPPSPRRRTLRPSSGEFIRSAADGTLPDRGRNTFRGPTGPSPGRNRTSAGGMAQSRRGATFPLLAGRQVPQLESSASPQRGAAFPKLRCPASTQPSPRSADSTQPVAPRGAT